MRGQNSSPSAASSSEDSITVESTVVATDGSTADGSVEVLGRTTFASRGENGVQTAVSIFIDDFLG